MSQLEQTLEALRNAEAAGRKEDAEKLAVIANRLANSQESCLCPSDHLHLHTLNKSCLA